MSNPVNNLGMVYSGTLAMIVGYYTILFAVNPPLIKREEISTFESGDIIFSVVKTEITFNLETQFQIDTLAVGKAIKRQDF